LLAKIDEYTFEINKTSFEQIKRTIDFNFNSNKRLGNFDSWQNTGKYEEAIEINGILIAKSQNQLKSFELMARKKLPVTLAFTNGTCSTILILKIETEQSTFLKDGSFLKQTYKINLVVIGDKS
jgi:phage protein U